MNSEVKGEMNTNIIHVELIKKDSWEKTGTEKQGKSYFSFHAA